MRYISIVLIFLIIIGCSSQKEITFKESNLKDSISKHLNVEYKYLDFFNGKIVSEAIIITPDLYKKMVKYCSSKDLSLENHFFQKDFYKDRWEFILLFYTPERKWNNLDQKESLWSISLIIDSQNYKVYEINELRGDLAPISKLLNRKFPFSKIYKLVFLPKIELNRENLIKYGEVKLTINSVYTKIINKWLFKN